MEEKENIPVSCLSPMRQRQQELYKKTPDWKKKYKDRCKERLRGNRSKLVDQFRKINLVEDAMRKEAQALADELDLDWEIFNQIRQELLEEEALFALEMASGLNPEIDDSGFTEDVETAACPSCSKNLAIGLGCLCCNFCSIRLEVSPQVLSESYSSWFSAHFNTGCDWKPDVLVIWDNPGIGRILLKCEGCELSDYIPNLNVFKV